MRGAMRHAQANQVLGQLDKAHEYAEQALCLLKQRDDPIEETSEVFDTYRENIHPSFDSSSFTPSVYPRISPIVATVTPFG